MADKGLQLGAMIRREIAPEHVAAHAIELAASFDELWVVEDVPSAGGISQLTHVLDVTAASDVRVGHGLAPAPFRNPMALAMDWATCARLHPGRLICGLGHGVQSWMADIGEGVGSPLTLLEETAVAVKSLLNGDDPEIDGRYRKVSGWKLSFPPAEPPPLLFGVTGPRSLAMSGRIADGTIIPEGFGPEQIRNAKAIIAEGDTPDTSHHLTLFAGFHLGDADSYAAAPWHPDESWVAVGDASAVIETLAEAVDLVDSLVLVPLAQDPIDQLRRAVDDVVPALRALS